MIQSFLIVFDLNLKKWRNIFSCIVSCEFDCQQQTCIISTNELARRVKRNNVSLGVPSALMPLWEDGDYNRIRWGVWHFWHEHSPLHLLLCPRISVKYLLATVKLTPEPRFLCFPCKKREHTSLHLCTLLIYDRASLYKAVVRERCVLQFTNLNVA